eukprot:scaffold172918_cov31-Tisochrysis_lutea.AAC.4
MRAPAADCMVLCTPRWPVRARSYRAHCLGKASTTRSRGASTGTHLLLELVAELTCGRVRKVIDARGDGALVRKVA